jgi:hypothetical protein
MSSIPEQPWRATVVACLAWGAAVTAVAYPIYVSVGDAYQEVVVRLAAAAILGIVMLQIRSRLARGLEEEPRSRFDLAREPTSREVKVDPHLRELFGEVRNSVKSRRYFEHVLWPRLLALARRQALTLRPPALRWPTTRGPSLISIAKLISTIEHKP